MPQHYRAQMSCHDIPRRTVVCCLCSAAWEECYVAVTLATDQDKPVCPRCLPSTLTVEDVIEAEISVTLLTDRADPAAIRKDVTERYQKFLASERWAPGS